MAFREVNSLDAEVTITIGGKDKKTGKANPKSLEGFYLGKRQVDSGKYGESTLYFFKTEKGNVGVWGKTNLNKKMSGIEPGSMMLITHVGMTPTTNGDMHTYKVEIDPDNTIDVSEAIAASDNSSSEDDSDSEDTDSSEEDDQESEEQEDEAPVQQVAASERQSRVQALLSKKNTSNKRVS